MQAQSLNGIWSYQAAGTACRTVTVPFSALPVGHSACSSVFDLQHTAQNIALKFDGVLREGLVDKFRNPRINFEAFCKAIRNFDAQEPEEYRYNALDEIDKKLLFARLPAQIW